ncbi:hypothetical protein FOA52_004682 [Chlamydomonas sp. UWO 241]|nr:hypothetical protein FOA52_004682 [Chlamydomonas sp. UWO 241]
MQTGTNLPPGVPAPGDGRPKGELVLRVGNMQLLGRGRGGGGRPARPTLAFVRWWGDAGPGVCLTLEPGGYEAVVFPLCCGPKYLTRYLRDMSSLVLMLEKAHTHVPIGRCVIDVRWLDVERPVAGSFPVLRPQHGVGGVGAAASAAGLGTMGTHAGMLDARLDIAYHSATTSSFELHEHMAGLGMLGLPALRTSRQQQQQQALPGPSPGQRNPAIGDPDDPADGVTTAAEGSTAPIDLFEVLLHQLQNDFPKFCDVFAAWRGSEAVTGGGIDTLVARLQAYHILTDDLTEEQVQYLQYMIDPKGDLKYDVDEVVAAIRLSLEAGIVVRSGQLTAEVAPLLAPLAVALQNGQLVVKQAFRESSVRGVAGVMMLRRLVSTLVRVLPPMRSQQLRLLLCCIVHQGAGGQPFGLVSFADVGSFLRQAAAWGLHKSACMVPAARHAQSPNARSSRGSPAQRRVEQPPPQPPATGRRQALARLKQRRSAQPAAQQSGGGGGGGDGAGDQPPSAREALADAAASYHRDQISAYDVASAAKSKAAAAVALLTSDPMAGRPLLSRAAPRQPTFVDVGKPGPLQQLVEQHHAAAQQQPVTTDIAAAAAGTSKAAALDEIVRKAEALRASLSDASASYTTRSAGADGRHPLRGSEGDALDVLRFITVPEVARDIVRSSVDAGWAQHQRQRRARSAQHRPNHDAYGSRDDGSDQSEDDDFDEDDEDEGGAAAWSERQLLQHLFFPATSGGPGGARGGPGDGSARGSPGGGAAAAGRSGGAAAAAAAAGGGGIGPGWEEESEEEGSGGSPEATPRGARGAVSRADASLSPSATQQQQQATDDRALAHLSLALHELALPEGFDTANADLSLIVKCTLLPALSQRQHWPLPRPGQLLSLSLAQPFPGLGPIPVPLALELWSHREELVGVAATRLRTTAVHRSADELPTLHEEREEPGAGPELARSSGRLSLRNPLAMAAQEAALAGCDISLTARVLGPSGAPASVSSAGDARTTSAASTGAPDAMTAVRHTFRVTVCGGLGLPEAADYEEMDAQAPVSRFIRYQYPGDPEPLFTEDVPTASGPIFAASAAHSVVLHADDDVGEKLGEAAGSGGGAAAHLRFELWQRFECGAAPSLAGTASIPLSRLAALALAERHSPAGAEPPATLLLALEVPPGADVVMETAAVPAPQLHDDPHLGDGSDSDDQSGGVEGVDRQLRGSCPTLEVRLQYEWEPAPAESAPPSGGVGGLTSSPPRATPDGVDSVESVAAPSPEPARVAVARLSVDIIQAVGLQAAVIEAQAWMGSGAALMGRSHLVGPNPYVTLSLLPGAATRDRSPRVQTPYLAQAFCPRFDHHTDHELSLNTNVVDGLATQHLCLEVWHHTSRSLALALSPHPGSTLPGGGAPAIGSGIQDVLLGCASAPVSSLLLHPSGLSGWLLLRSPRGEAVGAVQVNVRLTDVNGCGLDACSDAPPPLSQSPLLASLLPAAAARHLAGLAPWALPRPSAGPSTSPDIDLTLKPRGSDGSTGEVWLPDGFAGQWCRLTLHVDQLTLPSPGAAVELRPKAYKYYVTYVLPGSDDEVHTAACSAVRTAVAPSASGGPDSGSAPLASHSWHVPLRYCGVHWVRASAGLAAALARRPLRARAWRASGRAATAAAASGARASGGAAAAACGEVLVDLAPLVSAAATARAHQPSTRWLSGSFTLVDSSAKLFSNSRLQVRALLELMPTTLPPAAWLAKSAWAPVHPPPQPQPAHTTTVTQRASPARAEAAAAQPLPTEAAAAQPSSPTRAAVAAAAAAAAASSGAAYVDHLSPAPVAMATSADAAATAATAAATAATAAATAATAETAATAAATAGADGRSVGVSGGGAGPGAATAAGSSTTSPQQPQPAAAGARTRSPLRLSHGSSASLDALAASVCTTPAASPSTAAAAAAAASPGYAGSPEPSPGDAALYQDKEALRRQLQELEMLSLGWADRLSSGSSNGSGRLGAAAGRQAAGTGIPATDQPTSTPQPPHRPPQQQQQEGAAAGTDVPATDQQAPMSTPQSPHQPPHQQQQEPLHNPPHRQQQEGVASPSAQGGAAGSTPAVDFAAPRPDLAPPPPLPPSQPSRHQQQQEGAASCWVAVEAAALPSALRPDQAASPTVSSSPRPQHFTLAFGVGVAASTSGQPDLAAIPTVASPPPPLPPQWTLPFGVLRPGA